MGRSAASKEQMMMRDKDMSMKPRQMMMEKKDMMMKPKQMPMKDKQGFPVTPMKDKFADDLGYFTKARKPGISRGGK